MEEKSSTTDTGTVWRPSQVARELGISDTAVYTEIHAGRLTADRNGGRWAIDHAEYVRFAAEYRRTHSAAWGTLGAASVRIGLVKQVIDPEFEKLYALLTSIARDVEDIKTMFSGASWSSGPAGGVPKPGTGPKAAEKTDMKFSR
jgi:hypothetical protein